MRTKLFTLIVLFILAGKINSQDYSWLGKKLNYSDSLKHAHRFHDIHKALEAPEKVLDLEMVLDKKGANYKLFCDNISKFKNLRKLVLNNSHGLTLDLPAEIWQMKKMEYLSIDYFKEEKANGIENLQSLLFLSLPGWGMKEIPKEILTLKNLAVLDLSLNQISQIPDEIAQLKSLRELELTNNCFTEIPDKISLLTSLEDFTMNNADFSGTITPQMVGICQNSFVKFPDVFSKMKTLKRASIFYKEHVDHDMKKKIKKTFDWIKFS